MSPATIIIQATADGVRLALSATGTIKATGEAAVVNRWLPLIREHKVDIISELQAAANDAVQIWPDLPVDRNNQPDMPGKLLASFQADSDVDRSIVTACPDCQHFARPGKSDGYCGGRDDLPLAYGENHPLRRLPADRGASCDQWQASQ
jgi:hypothetical protein